MENRQDLGRRVGFLWLILSVFILFRCTKAENRLDPTGNVNLSPFQEWRSAHWCMENFKKTSSCPANWLLTEAGVLNVDKSKAADFCTPPGGCADQTRAVLKCIYEVKRDYWFANAAKTKVKDITHIIDGLCNPPPSG